MIGKSVGRLADRPAKAVDTAFDRQESDNLDDPDKHRIQQN
jgi:hypothetical protein